MKYTRATFLALMLSALWLPAAEKSGVLAMTCTVGKDEPAFKAALVAATLWEYDPLLADASAKPVAKVELRDAAHEPGKDSIFKLGLSAKLAKPRKYYVTVFIYPDNQVDEKRRLYFIDGMQKVFEKGVEEKLNLTLKRVRR